jgi:hypothetical protein
MAHKSIAEEKKGQVIKPKRGELLAKSHAEGTESARAGLTGLQQQVGNRTLQRLLTQRTSDAPTDLDDATAARINQARGRGQSLDTTLQMQMSQALGHDLSGVRVHTSGEAHDLNQQLSAKAFTTGQDIFFRDGAYDPHSSGGQELIAHELTHVVQQSSGAVGGGGSRMTVNPPDDAYEQEADSVAKQVTTMSHASAGSEGVQRQDLPEEEEELQAKRDETVQRQEVPEEEEAVQTKAMQRQEGIDEEEELQTKAVQREEVPEEEELG